MTSDNDFVIIGFVLIMISFAIYGIPAYMFDVSITIEYFFYAFSLFVMGFFIMVYGLTKGI